MLSKWERKIVRHAYDEDVVTSRDGKELIGDRSNFTKVKNRLLEYGVLKTVDPPKDSDFEKAWSLTRYGRETARQLLDI